MEEDRVEASTRVDCGKLPFATTTNSARRVHLSSSSRGAHVVACATWAQEKKKKQKKKQKCLQTFTHVAAPGGGRAGDGSEHVPQTNVAPFICCTINNIQLQLKRPPPPPRQPAALQITQMTRCTCSAFPPGCLQLALFACLLPLATMSGKVAEHSGLGMRVGGSLTSVVLKYLCNVATHSRAEAVAEVGAEAGAGAGRSTAKCQVATPPVAVAVAVVGVGLKVSHNS